MLSQHGMFAPENRTFDIHYLINNMQQELASFYQDNPLKPLQITFTEQTEKRPYPHYTLHLGDLFHRDLFHFFRKHGLVMEIDLENEEDLIIHIQPADLANANLTYQDAHEFLFHLHEKCMAQQKPGRTNSC